MTPSMPVTPEGAVIIAGSQLTGRDGVEFMRDEFRRPDGLAAGQGERGVMSTHIVSPVQPTILSERLTTTGSGSVAAWNALPADADYEVQMELLCFSANATHQGCLGRLQTADLTGYCTRWNNGQIELLRFMAGAAILLGVAVPYVPTPGTAFTLGLKMVGDQISALLDGVEVVAPVTNGDITLAGRVGVRYTGAQAGQSNHPERIRAIYR